VAGERTYLGEFEQLVLLAIVRLADGAGGADGAAIRRLLEARAGRTVSIGALYATLDRLEHKGYAASKPGVSSPLRGGRPRRGYRVTAAGQRALEQSRRMLQAMWDGLAEERS
jgi:DNA-binding PadR family transcriptional regulator